MRTSILIRASSIVKLATLVLSAASAFAQDVKFGPGELEFSESLAKTLKAETDNRLYNKVYRNSIEICGGSRWQKRNAALGGNFGHGFAILHGACRVLDPVSGIQQLKVCPGQTLGISTDSNFKSVQWIAVQGREMALYGGLSPSSPLDPATYQRMLSKAAAEGFLTGVKFRADSTEVTTELNSQLEYTAGTEFAIAVPRLVNCTRLPLVGTKPGREDGPLEDVIAYFNKLNQDAYRSYVQPREAGKPEGGYDYDVQVNNCTHTPYNSLAAVGFWPAKNIEGHPEQDMKQLLFRLKDAAVPFNTLLEVYDRGNLFTLAEIISWLEKSPVALKTLKENGWLGMQAGIIIEEIPPHNFKNSVFDPEVHLEFYSSPKLFASYFCAELPIPGFMCRPVMELLSRIQPSFRKRVGSPEMKLARNLEIWRARYESFLQDPRLQSQDAIATALSEHFGFKLRETVELLQRLPTLEQEAKRSPDFQFDL